MSLSGRNIFFPLSFLLLCVLPAQIHAQIQSAAPGAWSSPSTWAGGAVPGAGQSAVIAHPVTITGPTIVGQSAASGGPAAITVVSGGFLEIAANTTLTARGNVLLNNAQLILNEGSQFIFDSSLAPQPGLTRYMIQIGTDHLQPDSRLVLRGTQQNRCTITSNNANGALNGIITDGEFLDGGQISGTWCNFIRIGDATVEAVSTSPSNNGTFSLVGGYFEQSGRLQTRFNVGGGATFVLQNSTFKNMLSSESLRAAFFEPLTTGARTIQGNVFSRVAEFFPPRGATITDNIFLEGYSVSSDPENEGWATFANNFIRNPTPGEMLLVGDSTNNYWLTDPQSPELDINPHFVQVLSFGSVTMDGDIFEYTGADDNGDCVIVGEPAAPATFTMRNCLVLPNSVGLSSGTLFSALGNANVTMVVEHNTYATGNQGAAVSETYAGHPGMLQSFRSNLAWGVTPGGFKLYDSGPNDDVIDLVPSGAVSHNTGFQLAGGYMNLEFSSGTPGANDRDVDPLFTDATRNLAMWDLSRGGPGTVAHALEEMTKRNDPTGFNQAYGLQTLRDFVRGGFFPTNPALLNAGHDGTTIGAVPATIAITPVPTPTATPIGTPPPTPTVNVNQPHGSTPTPVPTPAPNGAPTVKIRRQNVTVFLPANPERNRYVVRIRGKNFKARARTQKARVRFKNVPAGRYSVTYVIRRPGFPVAAFKSPKTQFRVRVNKLKARRRNRR